MRTVIHALLALCLAVSPGVAQTYVTLSGSYSDFTFESATYYISNNVILTGTTIIEGGAVIKYAAGKSLIISDAILCETSPQHPAIFTAKDDDTVGIQIAGSTGSPAGYYADVALILPEADGSTLSHLRLAYANAAILSRSYTNAVFPSDVIEHTEFFHCNTGIAAIGPDDNSQTESSVSSPEEQDSIGGGGNGLHARSVEMNNILFSEGSQVIDGKLAHVNLFQLTVYQADYLAYGSDVAVLVRESVLANVSQAGGGGANLSGSDNGYYHSTNALFGFSPNFVTTNYPFQSFLGNDYYLTNGSPFVDMGGSWTATNAGVESYTTQTNQLPDTGPVDLGYHYARRIFLELDAECNTNGAGIRLDWGLGDTGQQMVDAGFTIEYFNLYRANASGGPYALIDTEGDVSQTSYVDLGATPGQTYYYVATFAYYDPNTYDSAETPYSDEAASPFAARTRVATRFG